jgi:hypothetical protein
MNIVDGQLHGRHVLQSQLGQSCASSTPVKSHFQCTIIPYHHDHREENTNCDPEVPLQCDCDWPATLMDVVGDMDFSFNA